MSTRYVLAAALASLLALSACEKKSAMEQKMDDALDRRPGEEIRDAAEDLSDSAKELGEAVQDTAHDMSEEAKDVADQAKQAAEDVSDDVHDAAEKAKHAAEEATGH